MADPQQSLTSRFTQAIQQAFGPDLARIDPLVRSSTQPQFGDYQANVAMSLAGRLKQPPRQVAQRIVDHLQVSDLCSRVEIAGPGFINLHLNQDYLAQQVAHVADDPRLGLPAPAKGGGDGGGRRGGRVVVDYSSPNVAKEMHVGHIRSTIIGDCIARVLSMLGHTVIRQNHIGDWGTQFGMLIEFMRDQGVRPDQAEFHVGDLNAMYQQAKQKFDTDADFAQRARQRVVALQGGDADTVALWKQLVAESYRHFSQVYDQLNVLLTEQDIRGESFYNPFLAGVLADLEKLGLLVISQGAAVVFPPGFVDKDNQPLPLIVRKTDGGYLYATTDLAAARYRINQLQADRIIYVTDVRQAQHFAMVFATLRQAGWAPEHVRLDHVAFGTILGKDRKPFKTREGGTVRLLDLLEQAQVRAGQVVAQKAADLPEDQQQRIARVVGIGALKYADLSTDRIKDYVFDWDRMLAMEGNTAPYLQNAYVRIRSIFRRGQIDPADLPAGEMLLDEPAERALGLKLLQLPTVVASVADSLEPHRLCNYLYELAGAFHQFYEQCAVLRIEDQALRVSRLRLCDLTARVLRQGLDLLGIEVVEQM